ncbi:MAG: hypothetical protein U0667_06260 [Chloroflexota bacterium]
MTSLTVRDLEFALAKLIDLMERFGAVVMSPDGGDDVVVAHEPSGRLRIRLQARLSASRSGDAGIDVIELWGPASPGMWDRVEYAYELRDHRLGYRRALHKHDVGCFVRRYDVVTHEHCESTIGVALCPHFTGEPVRDAADGFLRLYGQWLENSPPDCTALRCLDTS